MSTDPLTPAQSAVLRVLQAHGPMTDAALVPLAQHMDGVHQSSSGIRSRRAELARKLLVRETGDTIKMPSGRRAKVWTA